MEQQRQIFLPDFLLIPYQLISDYRIDSMDEKVYAIVYWYEHLKDGICTASNEEIAAIVHAETETGSRSIQNSLAKLESLGYITREYDDESRRHRTAIYTNIAFRRLEKNEKSKIRAMIATPKEETPGEFAKRFMIGDSAAIQEIIFWVNSKATIPESALKKELMKFIAYWTEPNRSGTKERWQQEKVFEVRRRVATWLSNIKNQAKSRDKGFTV